MAGVIENYSKFEVHTVVRFLQAEGSECLGPERFQPKGSACVVQQI
jgi:hypothetical protein